MKPIIFLIALLISPATLSTPVNVFFAGGQSNAKLAWAEAIESRLTESGRYEEVVVVQNNSGGAWLNHWINPNSDAATEAYKHDFFNENGTGNLQAAISGLTGSGDDPVFSGFFWMQGESDSLDPNAISRYAESFNLLLQRINIDLGFAPSDRQFNVSLGAVSTNADAAFPAQLQASYPDHDIDAMRQVQFNIASADPFISITDSHLYERYDYWHMTNESLVSLGENMATDFLGLTPVPLPPAIYVFFCAVVSLLKFRKLNA